MSTDRNRPGAITWSVVLVTVLLTAYFSAYFAFVKPQPGFFAVTFSNDPMPVIPCYSGGVGASDPRSSPTERLLGRLFMPIHLLDRKIRPAKWAGVRAV